MGETFREKFLPNPLQKLLKQGLEKIDFKQVRGEKDIKRATININGKDIKVEKVREFGMDEFGDYAGYVQLYMFHYARKSGLMEKLK